MRILVTGGAGFIGAATVRALLDRGHAVVVYDDLSAPQHRGNGQRGPVPGEAEMVVADVRDRDRLAKALGGVEAVIHLAAAVGVGQSMYDVRRYADVNCVGVATLLDIVANERHVLRRLVVASSMSIYGEGAYHCAACDAVTAPGPRPEAQLDRREWEMRCPACGGPAAPCPTPEDRPLRPGSIYAMTKRDHEEMVLAVGRAYDVPAFALRYFNVFGPGQTLANPYTGVAAIQTARLLAGRPPMLYEDGLQTRDFVDIRDVARANVAAVESPAPGSHAVNIGSGRGTTLMELCATLREALGRGEPPVLLGTYRRGDVRHCSAAMDRARDVLGFTPAVGVAEGLRAMASWAVGQSWEDRFDEAHAELCTRGLVR